MRTEMTRAVGFDRFWDAGGAVTPDVAARSLIDWIETHFDLSKTGQFWAPRGPRFVARAHQLREADSAQQRHRHRRRDHGRRPPHAATAALVAAQHGAAVRRGGNDDTQHAGNSWLGRTCKIAAAMARQPRGLARPPFRNARQDSLFITPDRIPFS